MFAAFGRYIPFWGGSRRAADKLICLFCVYRAHTAAACWPSICSVSGTGAGGNSSAKRARRAAAAGAAAATRAAEDEEEEEEEGGSDSDSDEVSLLVCVCVLVVVVVGVVRMCSTADGWLLSSKAVMHVLCVNRALRQAAASSGNAAPAAHCFCLLSKVAAPHPPSSSSVLVATPLYYTIITRALSTHPPTLSPLAVVEVEMVVVLR